MQISRKSAQVLEFDNQSRGSEAEALPDRAQRHDTFEAAPRPLAIECRGRKWAVVRFARPLTVARECACAASGSVSYLVGVSHARLWFVSDGQSVEPVRRGFVGQGIQMDIRPWETPEAALRRHVG